MYKFAGNILD